MCCPLRIQNSDKAKLNNSCSALSLTIPHTATDMLDWGPSDELHLHQQMPAGTPGLNSNAQNGTLTSHKTLESHATAFWNGHKEASINDFFSPQTALKTFCYSEKKNLHPSGKHQFANLLKTDMKTPSLNPTQHQVCSHGASAALPALSHPIMSRTALSSRTSQLSMACSHSF